MNERKQTNSAWISPPPKARMFAGAFHIRVGRYPWDKAAAAALTMGICVALGALIGRTSWGLFASVGGFASLYVHNDAYAKRAKKVLFAAVGLAVSLGLGSLGASHAWSIALTLGVVSMCATFVAGVFRLPPPGGYFFILACALGTGLPLNVAETPLRFFCALAGGAVAWLISMAGWVRNPYKPAEQALGLAFREVAGFLAEGKNTHIAQHNAALALRASEAAVSSSGRGAWRRPGATNRLQLLNQCVKELFTDGVAINAEGLGPIHRSFSEMVRKLADGVTNPDGANLMDVPKPTKDTPARRLAYQHLKEATLALVTRPSETSHASRAYQRLTTISRMRGALSRESLVLPAVLRMGVTVIVATIIAYLLGDERPYWVPLTCASVLQGPTMVAKVHRTVQRALGTALGICIAGLILTFHMPVIGLILCLMVLQWGVELIIVRNYGLAVIFITPLPLILAQAGLADMSPMQLVQARLIDTVVGCVLGLMGATLLWSRASSKSLPRVMSSALRGCEQLIVCMQSERCNLASKQTALEGAIVNLRLTYDSAASELWRQSAVESLWPAVISAQRLGYALLAISQNPVCNEEVLDNSAWKSLRTGLSQMACAVEEGQPVSFPTPDIEAYPGIASDYALLAESLSGNGGRLP